MLDQIQLKRNGELKDLWKAYKMENRNEMKTMKGKLRLKEDLIRSSNEWQARVIR